MRHRHSTTALFVGLCAGLSLPTATALAQTAAPAQTTPAATAAEQVIQPQVQRRDVKPPRYPSNDIAIGVFGGVYATENFGTSGVSGVRLGYQITEDFFVDGTWGRTKVSDEAYRLGRPGGVFAVPIDRLTYYGVSLGWNALPGEVFVGRNLAWRTQGYVLAGFGTTEFAATKQQTWHAGFGGRVIVKDWFALQADVRNHVFPLDLLGERRNTQNLEVTFGLTVFF